MRRLAVVIGLLIAQVAAGCVSSGQKATPESTGKAMPGPSSTSTGPIRAAVGQALIITGDNKLKVKVTPASVKICGRS